MLTLIKAITYQSLEEGGCAVKRKILVLVVAALMLIGSALPALATHGPSGRPEAPVCEWDWDRYLWNQYDYEMWYYGCDYGDDGFYINAFWNPDYGYWYP